MSTLFSQMQSCVLLAVLAGSADSLRTSKERFLMTNVMSLLYLKLLLMYADIS
jgi:hypothetical protein